LEFRFKFFKTLIFSFQATNNSKTPLQTTTSSNQYDIIPQQNNYDQLHINESNSHYKQFNEASPQALPAHYANVDVSQRNDTNQYQDLTQV